MREHIGRSEAKLQRLHQHPSVRWRTDGAPLAVHHAGMNGPSPYFHEPTDAVRFWVPVDGGWVGATVGRATLHYRFCPHARDDDPLVTYQAFAQEMEAAVRRRIATGSIEPVMLREYDLPRPNR